MRNHASPLFCLLMTAALAVLIPLTPNSGYGEESAQKTASTPDPTSRVEKIRVDRAHRGFIDEEGRPFVPFGVSYYRPGTGWAPQVWKQFDAEATRRDFALLKKEGVNVVRVFISYSSFWSSPDQLNSDGVAKFDQFLNLADEAGIHVHPTGPDAWDGIPLWLKQFTGADGPNAGNKVYLEALKQYWKMFATRYRDRKTIWAYDLRNEPEVGWNTPLIQERWKEWRQQHHEEVAAIPDPKATPADPNLLEFQHFRESLAEEWTSVQSKAIHDADPNALVSVGLIQWSIPAQQMGLTQYSAFRPSVIAPYLDFMELHFYPYVSGAYKYSGPDSEKANLSVLESMARECAKPGLPLVLSEFGWYGGGALKGGPVATEEQQAQWCRHVVEVTSPLACGWLNWGMYDNPQATDVSVFTGLFTVDGKEKAWGRTFHQLADQYRAVAPIFQMPDRPDLPWDDCVVSVKAMEDFRNRYLESFQKNAHENN